MAIDKRRHYILMLDTETANTIPTETGLDMSNVLVYDIGWAVIDKSGNVYECASFVNRDVLYMSVTLCRAHTTQVKSPCILRTCGKAIAPWQTYAKSGRLCWILWNGTISKRYAHIMPALTLTPATVHSDIVQSQSGDTGSLIERKSGIH